MRIGIVLRLIGILVLGSMVAIQGNALKTRAFEGKIEHYTVMIKASEDAQAVAAEHAKNGVRIERVVNDGPEKAYVASMGSKKTDTVRNDPRVAYLVLDAHMKVKHGWWETTMISLGMSSPSLG